MIKEYYQILSKEYPIFLNDYIECPILQRLKGIGLFCGTDYCGLFNPIQFYSRLDHSIGVALIIWNFTKDKQGTIAGLLHDVSSPVFSHTIDFMNNDYLIQESTEDRNDAIILSDQKILSLLQRDHIDIRDVLDYRKYPIADNDIPKLSADRLEYMYSTGLFSTKSFTLNSIEQTYGDIHVNWNEENIQELSFYNDHYAKEFVKKSLVISTFFQSNEDKLALQFLASIISDALEENLFQEKDLYLKTENEIWNDIKKKGSLSLRNKLTFFEKIDVVHQSDTYVSNTFCIHLKVKKRYIDPLVKQKRFHCISKENEQIISSFLTYEEKPYAYVKEYQGGEHYDK